MLNALFEDQNGCGIAWEDLRWVGQISQIELGRMSTPEKIDEISGREQQTPGEKLHR